MIGYYATDIDGEGTRKYRVRVGQYREQDTFLCRGTVAIIAVHLTFRILKL